MTHGTHLRVVSTQKPFPFWEIPELGVVGVWELARGSCLTGLPCSHPAPCTSAAGHCLRGALPSRLWASLLQEKEMHRGAGDHVLNVAVLGMLLGPLVALQC